MEHAGKLAVVAVGGNALIRDKHHESIPDQSREAALTVHHIADMIAAGWNVVITHGTGPQVGFILRRSELALEEVPPVPMDYADADLQGGIGYMFLKALYNEFRTQKLDRKAVAIITQTLVDPHDPAFADPSKPIGSHMDEQTAHRLASRQGWVVKEDAGRGWRRVVPSPLPKTIVELAAIKTLARAGFVVIACGGGGIPVIESEEGGLTGVEAVIDKDLTSSLLARGIGADLLMVSTGVEKVAINFNRPNQQWLNHMTLADAKRHLADNQFDKGSMGPKIQAVVEFLEGGGRMGLITDPPNIGRALAGKTGTFIVRDGPTPSTLQH
ncbi:MAG: carbamate kinase [Nitrospiraceae bacterium]|jgi:carbamate kinase|uniref:carbamate kinase n=1 Tax=Nitrospira cf. moscoviensis SBR1015 TaxID=96242 RepID=UPI000A0B36C3|nr:carbamate kinase [Nitrospira cf. moscoviensis SBR1015]MBY0248532.1 carbamate kinase [Nitrospiraceae bacterium]OQW35640.1 MAG: carbamate kinase [Nitrospira sp. SG-bin2]